MAARVRRDADVPRVSPLAMLAETLGITDLGRLALVVFAVITLTIGVAGLWTAATEPRPQRAEVLDGLTLWDEWMAGPLR